MTRLHSVGALIGTENIYSPMSSLATLGNNMFRGKAAKMFDLADNELAFSGGMLSFSRAADQINAMDQKVARRAAAGKSTSRLDRRLIKAQEQMLRIGGQTRAGVDIFNTFETTLQDLRKAQISTRVNPLNPYGQATGGRVPGQYATYGGGPGVSNVSGQQGFQRLYRNPDRLYFHRTASPDLPGNTKVSIIRGPDGKTFRAVLPTGETRGISREIGAMFAQSMDTPGYKANVMVSNVPGAVTQQYLGYSQAVSGYAKVGGLSGRALRGANNALIDMGKVMGQFDDAFFQTGKRGAAFNIQNAADDLIKGGKVTATVDDIIKTQQRMAAANTGAGGRTLTEKAFNANARNARLLAGPSAPTVAQATDIIAFNSAGLGVNTTMVQGTSGRMISKDLLTNLARQQATPEMANAMLRSFGEKGLIRTVGTKNAMGMLTGQFGKEGAKIAGNIAFRAGMKVANPILTASLVYDLSKMAATAVIGGGARLAKDAIKSAQGQINKPGFGMGFKDNEVAATSRARGVAAIQNSRLNARSSLGAEAAAMAARFG